MYESPTSTHLPDLNSQGSVAGSSKSRDETGVAAAVRRRGGGEKLDSILLPLVASSKLPDKDTIARPIYHQLTSTNYDGKRGTANGTKINGTTVAHSTSTTESCWLVDGSRQSKRSRTKGICVKAMREYKRRGTTTFLSVEGTCVKLSQENPVSTSAVFLASRSLTSTTRRLLSNPSKLAPTKKCNDGGGRRKTADNKQRLEPETIKEEEPEQS